MVTGLSRLECTQMDEMDESIYAKDSGTVDGTDFCCKSHKLTSWLNFSAESDLTSTTLASYTATLAEKQLIDRRNKKSV